MTVDDPYKVLGVAPDATLQEIRKRYRVLARAHHPDMNPGDEDATRRFRIIAAAYEVLINPDKQRKRGAKKSAQQPNARAGQKQGQKQGARAGQKQGQKQGARAGQKQGQKQGARAGQQQKQQGTQGATRTPGGGKKVPRSGRRARVTRVTVDLEQVVRPGVVDVVLPRRRRATVTIPPGADTGTVTVAETKPSRRRSRSRTRAWTWTRATRLVVELEVRPHKHFRRRGLDLYVRFAVAADTALRGKKVVLSTPHGPVPFEIKPGSRWGNLICIPHKGIQGATEWGRLYIELVPPS